MTGILKLIERQRTMWDIKGRLEDEEAQPGQYKEGCVTYGPCLLISRACGSGGSEVAQLTGKHLGWQVFDREIVDKIAQLAHARQHLVESVDEKVRTQWESTWRPMLDPEDIGCDAYLRYLREVVLTLGHHGDVVILGRGAQYILSSRCALRVRLVAPLKQRIQRVAQIKSLTLEQAETFVQRLDSERTTFIRRNFRSNSDSPLGYDLVLNTGDVPLGVTANIILAALHQKLEIPLTQQAHMRETLR
jgi:hypothetical protein